MCLIRYTTAHCANKSEQTNTTEPLNPFHVLLSPPGSSLNPPSLLTNEEMDCDFVHLHLNKSTRAACLEFWKVFDHIELSHPLAFEWLDYA